MLKRFLNWFAEPSGSQSDGRCHDAKHHGRHGQWQFLAVHNDTQGAAPIVGLLTTGGPAAVFGTVRPVGIDAIERAAGRTWPHVSVEPTIIGRPFVGHRDATSAVSRIARVGRVQASTLGALPRLVFFGMQAIGWQVPQVTVLDRVARRACAEVSAVSFFGTTTRGRVAGGKMATGDYGLFAAVALASPERPLWLPRMTLDNCQRSIPLSGPVFCELPSRHAVNSIMQDTP